MDKTDLKNLNAILKELYDSGSQVDVEDFCEYRLGVKDPNLYRRYADWLIEQGYARPDNPSHLLWLEPKGWAKCKHGLKMKDLKPKSSRSDNLLKWLKIAVAIITISVALYKFIPWLMGNFFQSFP